MATRRVSPTNGRRLQATDSSVEAPVATTYKLDQYRRECKINPFVFDTGDEEIVVAPPTGEQLMQISETPVYSGRELLRLICGDQFDGVWSAIKDEPGGVLVSLLNDIGKHFMITAIPAAPGGPVALPS